MLKYLAAPTAPQIARLVNDAGISKESIVSLTFSNNQYIVFYYG